MRPARCPCCDAAGHVLGERVTLVGHGLRDRQVRGPEEPNAPPRIVTVPTRRYRCRACRAVIVVVPRGVTARRHFSAPAIGLALLHFGVEDASADEVAHRVGLWGTGASAWRTLARWTRAIARGALLPRARVRSVPEDWPPRLVAERAATTLASLAPSSAASLAERVFAGAVLAA